MLRIHYFASLSLAFLNFPFSVNHANKIKPPLRPHLLWASASSKDPDPLSTDDSAFGLLIGTVKTYEQLEGIPSRGRIRQEFSKHRSLRHFHRKCWLLRRGEERRGEEQKCRFTEGTRRIFRRRTENRFQMSHWFTLFFFIRTPFFWPSLDVLIFLANEGS